MKKEGRRYTVLVVGAGRIGFSLGLDRLREQPASHAMAFAACRRTALAGAVDIDPAKLAAFRKVFPQARVYLDVPEAMGAEKPDIVVVAVPEPAHATVSASVFSFKPGLVVLEKPIAPNLSQARLIQRAAGRSGVPVSVNHERRFARDYASARALIERGAIGELHSVRARLWSGAAVWAKGAEHTGAASLLHDGTHLVDTVRFLTGQALGAPTIDFTKQGRSGKIVRLNLHYALRKSLLVQLEMAGDKRVFDFEIELAGETGLIRIGNGFFRLFRRAPSPFYSGFYSLRRDRSVTSPKKTGYFSLMVENCVDFLDGKAALVSPLSEGVKILEDLYQIVIRLKRTNTDNMDRNR